MSLFNKETAPIATTPLGNLENKYKNSVANLLLVIIFTVINIVLLVTNSNRYFLFSAFIPYVTVDYGMYFCGMYPEEYYYGDEEFLDQSFLIVAVAIAAVAILLYLLSWFFAKKKKVGWLIFSLIFFVADTAAMLWFTGFAADSIIDIIFHVWVIFSLGNGVYSYFKIKKLTAENPIAVMKQAELDSYQQSYENLNN